MLDGSRGGEVLLNAAYEIIEQGLKRIGWEVKLLKLRDMEIADCLGCLSCWTKNPGECVTNDDGKYIAKMVFSNDLLVFLTPVTFGGYSSCLERAVDRLIAAFLSSSVKIAGEFRHKNRFKKNLKFIAIGMLAGSDGSSQRLFHALARRNALNLQSPAHTSMVLLSTQKKESLKDELKTIFVKIGIMK